MSRYKHKVFIQQILSAEVEVETNNVDLTDEDLSNIVKPTDAMAYYDLKIVKKPVFKDWELTNETIDCTYCGISE